MKILLTGVCCLVLGIMLYVTISASLHQDVVSATQKLWPDPGSGILGRCLLRLPLLLALGCLARTIYHKKCPVVRPDHNLGNIATPGYLLLQVRHIRSGDNFGRLFS